MFPVPVYPTHLRNIAFCCLACTNDTLWSPLVQSGVSCCTMGLGCFGNLLPLWTWWDNSLLHISGTMLQQHAEQGVLLDAHRHKAYSDPACFMMLSFLTCFSLFYTLMHTSVLLTQADTVLASNNYKEQAKWQSSSSEMYVWSMRTMKFQFCTTGNKLLHSIRERRSISAM